jgi:hypothetical protein
MPDARDLGILWSVSKHPLNMPGAAISLIEESLIITSAAISFRFDVTTPAMKRNNTYSSMKSDSVLQSGLFP